MGRRPGVVGRFPVVPFGLGLWELAILAGVLILLFGRKGAPGMARRLAKGVREVKDAVAEVDPRTMLESTEKPAPAPPQRELVAAPPSAKPAPSDD